jgi:hypothetical protein
VVVAVGAGGAAAGAGAPHVAQVDQPGQPGGRVVLRLGGVGDHLRAEHAEDLLAGVLGGGGNRAGLVVDRDRSAAVAVDDHPAQQRRAQQSDVLR